MTRVDEIKKEADDLIVWLGENLALVKALKAGTWKAVPVEPTVGMIHAADDPGLLRGATPHIRTTFQRMLSAAPAKPEG